MPDPKNDEWKRVTDPKLKPHREWNVPADAVTDDLKVLDKPTHNLDGTQVPPKYTPSDLSGNKSGQAADNKEVSS